MSLHCPRSLALLLAGFTYSGLAVAATATDSHAHQGNPLPLAASAAKTPFATQAATPPWTAGIANELASLQDDPFTLDPGFHGGRWHQDRFDGTGNTDFQGRKLVRLANGDVIVAGLVPPFQGANPANGMWNIGLVRYNTAGVRVSFDINSPFHFQDSQYVVYPNSAAPAFTEIHDIQLLEDRIFVLADRRFSPTDLDVHVVVFGTNGVHVSDNRALGRTLDEYGAGLVAYRQAIPEEVRVIVVGNTVEAGGHVVPTLVRMIEQPNSTFLRDTSIGNANGYVMLHPPDMLCQPNVRPCFSRVNGVAATYTLGQSSPSRIYIVGTVRFSFVAGDQDFDYLVIATNAAGVPVSQFDEDGYRTVAFDSGGTWIDVGTSVRARRVGIGPSTSDEIFVAGYIERAGDSVGIGVAKLNGSGEYIAGFGAGGQQRFGGCATNVPSCTLFLPRSEPFDMSINGQRLAIVGDSAFTPLSCPNPPCAVQRDAMFAVLGATHGQLIEFAEYPLRDSVGGPRIGNSRAYGVVNAGTNAFALSGNGRQGNLSNRLVYMTGRVAPDRIFGNGLEP